MAELTTTAPVSVPGDLDTGQALVERHTGWDARTARTAVRACLKAGMTLDASVAVCRRVAFLGLAGDAVPGFVKARERAAQEATR